SSGACGRGCAEGTANLSYSCRGWSALRAYRDASARLPARLPRLGRSNDVDLAAILISRRRGGPRLRRGDGAAGARRVGGRAGVPAFRGRSGGVLPGLLPRAPPPPAPAPAAGAHEGNGDREGGQPPAACRRRERRHLVVGGLGHLWIVEFGLGSQRAQVPGE